MVKTVKTVNRKKRFSSVWKAITPSSMEELITLLTKIVGESVKGRIARALLIGALGSVGSYTATVEVAEIVESPKPEPKQVVDKPPVPEYPSVLVNDKAP